VVRETYRQGSTFFCQLLGEMMRRRGINPSQLSRHLYLAGFETAQGTCYKYASGDRNPSAAFIVGAARVLADPPEAEPFAIASLKETHIADVTVRLERSIAEELDKHPR